MPDRRPDQRYWPHKITEDSTLYDRIIPVLFVVLVVITVALIVFALGIVAGVIPWA